MTELIGTVIGIAISLLLTMLVLGLLAGALLRVWVWMVRPVRPTATERMTLDWLRGDR